MIVFRAMLLDAYRELNSRKLFWVTLIISFLVAASFSLVGINEEGLTLLWWDFKTDLFNSSILPPDVFYKNLFLGLGIGFWLSWLATILALVSTAGMFPTFVSGGAIDLVLSKPVSRLTLFVYKYITGLLFVAVQVTLFCIASFFVLGLRGGTWEPALFLAIPIIVIFYSYLYAICVLIGVLWRSTIAALLLTLLAWFFIFAIHSTESTVLTFKVMQESKIEMTQGILDTEREALEALRNRDDAQQVLIERTEARIAERESEIEADTGSLNTLTTVHRFMMAGKTILPKSTETIGLLERWMIDLADLPEPPPDEPQPGMMSNEDMQELMEEIRNRPVWWIVGTSLLFELVVLALAAWIFCRRDF